MKIALVLFVFFHLNNAFAKEFEVEKIVKLESSIWGFDFLSPNELLISERNGGLQIVDLVKKQARKVGGDFPKVWANGQGGLLDVRVRTDKKSGVVKIFLTYSTPSADGATTQLAVGELKEGKLTNLKILFTAEPATDHSIHFGSRLEFDEKGFLFMTIGDRNERHLAQDLKTHLGKVIRLREDGSVPDDNPFAKTPLAKKEIWSLGHRSPQGLVRDPASGDLWLTEMGPRGGDELNRIQSGANYGWPVVTFGREYWGPRIGEGSQKIGMENPTAHWVPSISPSGLTLYQGEAFPAWKGNLFLACLSGLHLRRLKVEKQQIVEQEALLKDLNLRFRNVRPGPDGRLYLSTDDGQLMRLNPIKLGLAAS